MVLFAGVGVIDAGVLEDRVEEVGVEGGVEEAGDEDGVEEAGDEDGVEEAGVEDAGVEDPVLEGTTLPLELAVKDGAVELRVVDAELVMLGRLDELEGDAEPLPVDEAVPEPDAPEDPSTLGKPVTTTEVG